MRLITKVFCAATALVMVSGTAIAQSPFEGTIKARQGLMQIYTHNIGQLAGMAKGKIPYDAKVASVAANNLKIAALIDQSAMWPQGSDNSALGEATAALPDIWTTFPKIVEKQKALIASTGIIAAEAGKDLAALRAAIGAVGKSCGSCHESFRKKSN